MINGAKLALDLIDFDKVTQQLVFQSSWARQTRRRQPEGLVTCCLSLLPLSLARALALSLSLWWRPRMINGAKLALDLIDFDTVTSQLLSVK